MRPLRVMTDLETVSQNHHAAIISIGAVKFGDGKLFDEFYEVISIQSCIDAGLHIQSETIDWWMKQSIEARAVLTQSRRGGKPLKEVLEKFSEFVINDKTELWGNGIVFDIGILERAYEACSLKFPIHWYNYMDARTIFKLQPRDQHLPREGTYHNALDDAKYQAKNLMHILDI